MTCAKLAEGKTWEAKRLKRAWAPLCVDNMESQEKGHGSPVGMKPLKHRAEAVMAFV
jgi:hypothetical protein